MVNIKEKKSIPSILNKEYSYNNICSMLDLEEKRYLTGKSKTYSLDSVWKGVKNRKNTFLTKSK